ncbi:H-NS family nucleoid-associated regulatory protein [Cupriavidus necator]|uniref:H-NS family nucleoid-associated regulatory protein n=1 Tax=Cupriavidus necator TaxID=106590 RepID=UPI00277D7D21|nr:H-NS family nucleoid-associated regulatory protein [Cupriavidus necator]MDQ0140649.1 DNA-binding protein H-NS [Cupriavidus necator]
MSESDSAKLAAVAWIREQMDRHALSIDDLIEAGCFDTVPPASAGAAPSGIAAPTPAPAAATPSAPNAAAPRRLYRNALGQSWDGQGEYPDWLQRAVNAGQSIEFFRVD